jgi:anti-sigma-K factor RskA
LTDREQATLPENDAESDERDVETAEAAAVEDDPTAETGVTTTEKPEATEAISAEPAPEPETLEWAEATAALVLGVLPPDDAAAAAQEIARSATLQAEVATLLPVADILLSLYQQTQPVPTVTATTAPVAAPAAERTPAEPARRVERPRAEPITRPAMPSLGGIRPSSILIGLFALIAAIGVLWALSLNDRIATKDDEITALKRQVEQFRQAANASAFTLTPTASAPDGARGTVFYSLADSRVIIDVSGLPELDQDRVYQVWFQRTGSNAWEPGPTFLVNQQGESVQRLPGETPTFARIAVSEEPAPGSAEPSGDFLLEGALSGGNG